MLLLQATVRQHPYMGHPHQAMVLLLLLLLRPAMVHHLLVMERLHPMDSLRLKIRMPSTSNSDR